jgi:DNA excision repair protein ERCC-8
VLTGSIPLAGRIDPQHRHAHTASISQLSWYPLDTGLFVSSALDGTVKVWDTNTLAAVAQFSGFGHVYGHSLTTTPAGCLIAVAHKAPEVVLCDVRTGARTHSLCGHKRSVLTAQWWPINEHVLVTGSVDNRVLFWDVRRASACLLALDYLGNDPGSRGSSSALPTAHKGAVNGLLFSSDGSWLVSTGTDERIRVWDAHSGRNTLTHFRHVSNKSQVRMEMALFEQGPIPLLFHPNRQDIGVYQLEDGHQARVLRAHHRRLTALKLHPRKPLLFSGSLDSDVLIWEPLAFTPPSDAEPDAPHVDLDGWSDDERGAGDPHLAAAP